MVEGKEFGGVSDAGNASIKRLIQEIEVWTPLLGLVMEGIGSSASQIVQAPPYEVVSRKLEVDGYVFDIQVIHWECNAPGLTSNLYLRNGRGHLVHKAPSPLRDRPHFLTSVCASSSWADRFTPETDPMHPEAPSPETQTWAKLLVQLDELGEEIYAAFIPKKAEQEVQGFEAKGFFPTYEGLDDDEQAWRRGHAREMVRQIYIAEPRLFIGGNHQQTKVLIRLLDRLAVSSDNDALMEVLNGALDLDSESLARLAGHLRRSSMENVVATIEVLQRRALAVQQLRHLMNEHHRELLETPDLQRIIENNTWLFGPRYETIGAEDDSFTKVAESLRESVFGNLDVNEDDVDRLEHLPAARRQTDLFLARKFPTLDSAGQRIYKCIVIEIKRPSISLNRKHLRQLEDYSDIIKRLPEFSSEKVHFELILIGRKLSSREGLLTDRLFDLSGRGEQGLVESRPRMKLYVMNWYSLLDSFELTNSFMLERLKLKRAELEGKTKTELVTELQEAH
ncbi:hypothetical protein [Roseateles chitinivorans]|uniref:hypothetical protein n=1 Tax=Roseateles chitinivorans TaxID=2917965 RepID=UPI003D668B67